MRSDADRYAFLRNLAVENGTLEAFVALKQIDFLESPKRFDEEIDKAMDAVAVGLLPTDCLQR